MAANWDGTSTDDDYIDNKDVLLRLVWSKRDLQEDGSVKTSNISKQDISGEPGKGYSVDREKLVKKSCVDALAARQRSRGLERSEDLGVPLIAKLVAGDVRAAQDNEKQLFEVIPDKLEATEDLPKNDAHSLIHSIEQHNINKKSVKNMLRTKLIALMTKPIICDEYFGD